MGFSMKVNKQHKWYRILAFFWLIYHSVAEGLPDRLKTALHNSSCDRVADDEEDEDSDDQTRRHK
eukprot:990791-Heterocapsa_arctica.AAC.1